MTEAALGDAESTLILEQLTDAAPGATFLAADEPRPFTLGQDGARETERLVTLERMGEKLVRTLKGAIEPFARARAQITTPPLLIETFGEWQDTLPAFVSLSLYRLRPLKGGMLIAIEPAFIAALVERFYGGASAGAARAPRIADFTASEELLLHRLMDRIIAILTEHWQEVTPVETSLAGRETSAAHIGFLRPEEAVVVQRFAIEAGGRPTTIAIVYPLAMLRPIEARMATKVHDDDDASSNDAWRRRLGHALAQVSLPVRSVLARPEISVAGLLALKPGDVIPITLAPRTPLLAGSRRIADGVIGEQEGRAALMIERVGDE